MKRSFTLIELLISVVILSILFLALSNVIAYLSNSSEFIKKKYFSIKDEKIYLKVLYYDILNADEVGIKSSGNYTVLRLHTKNSLYSISMPYVMWYVSKKENSLMRLESPQKINIQNLGENFYLDKFAQNVKIFKIYKKDGKYFVYVKTKKPVYFEMYKGF